MSDVSEDYFNTIIVQATFNVHALFAVKAVCQNTELFKLIEREGASRSTSLQASRWVLAWDELSSDCLLQSLVFSDMT